METTKTCSKCGAVKLAGEFEKHRAQCKECVKEIKRRYCQENAGAIAAQQRKYKRENAAAITERHRRYAQENAAAITERHRRYVQENAVAVAEWTRKYRHENAVAIYEQQRKYRHENAVAVYERQRKYRQENAPLFNERARTRTRGLADRYVASRLGSPTSQVTPELLAMKRSALRLKRTLRSIEKELKK